MVTTTGHGYEVPQKSLEIKEDDKFFSRLLSKEKNSIANKNNSSFRVYYGGAAGAVPFMWESTPGTPKHTLFSDSSLPPLTPPPSYQSFNSNKPNNNSNIIIQKHSKHNLLYAIFSRLSRKKSVTHVSPLSSSSTISSSPSYLSSQYSFSSSISSNSTKNKFRGRCFSALRPKSPLHFGVDDHEEQEDQAFGSPTSTLCFYGGREIEKNTSAHDGFRGCFGWRM